MEQQLESAGTGPVDELPEALPPGRRPIRKWHLLWGMCFLAFGVAVGNIGLGSAGVGLAIPMIPLGIYVVARGLAGPQPVPFEGTPVGGLLFGPLLVILGFKLSSGLLATPLVLAGIALFVFSISRLVERRPS